MIKHITLFILLSASLNGADPDLRHNRKVLAPFDKIVINQFGKTSSTSLFNLFGDLTSNTPIKKVPDHPTKGKAVHTHTSSIVKKFINNNEKLLIINVVRNLFDRNISHFFHILRREKRLSVNQEIDELLEECREFNLNVTNQLANWYDHFIDVYQIDLFGHPFNHQKRFALFQKENLTILILRFEDMAQWPSIFQKALNLRNMNLPKKNIMNAPLYDYFKSVYYYSEEEIESITSVNFMKYFYTDQELNKFIKKYNKDT